MRTAALVVGVLGTSVGIVVALTALLLGELAGLAESPDAGDSTRAGAVSLAAAVIAGAGTALIPRAARIAAATLALAAVVGVLSRNPLWIFAAALLALAALFAGAASLRERSR